MINLNRDEVITYLRETKNKQHTALKFRMSHRTLNNRLKEWGVFEEFHPISRPAKSDAVYFEPGEIVIWKPYACRGGFYGRPEGSAPWLCEIVSGPSKSGSYRLLYVGQNKVIRSVHKIYTVFGAWLFKKEVTT